MLVIFNNFLRLANIRIKCIFSLNPLKFRLLYQMSEDNRYFSAPLLKWYLISKRSLPWRDTRDPYLIWLSEVILQQTRVAQGLPYYEKFHAAYPTVQDLVAANEEEVLKLWQGLGYYSRARNLKKTAEIICEDFEGRFPETYDELLKLKGIGPYTAAAIASFAFKEKKAVVDGNVYRVLSRVFGIDEPINKSSGQKLFQELADSLIDPDNPDLFNQAIMEFGATECTPKKPNCTSCIFNDRCVALATNKVDALPVKLSKVKVVKRYLHYLMLLDQNRNTRFVKRPNHGIWAGLYEFPFIESDASSELTENEIELFLGQSAKVTLLSENPIVHKLSHRHLEVRVYRVEVKNLNHPVVSMDEIDQYPTSTLMERLLQQFKI